jgi:hypothetical protein
VRDKIGGVTGLPSPPSEPVFKRCQRAHPTEKFDNHRPDNRRQMNPDEAPPSCGQEYAEDRKHHESDVNQDNQIGKQLVG